MRFRVLFVIVVLATASQGQTSSPSSKQTRESAVPSDSAMDAGTLSSGVYRNRELGFSCKIPPGWVLRTDEMNARDEDEPRPEAGADQQKGSPPPSKAENTNAVRTDGRVLLAAFSRPPQATGEEVNSSILIAAEKLASYPGLKEAVQYFGPLAEVAKGQGFAEVGEPYEIAVGTKTLVRQDFQKAVGSRVMRQSTLVMLAHGYAVSFTFIAGTEEELQELVDELSFVMSRNTAK